MPYYRYPPAAGTPAAPPRDRLPWLLLLAASLLTLLLTPLKEGLLYLLLGLALCVLYLVVVIFPPLLVIGFLWLVVRLTSSPRRRPAVRRRPRPVPYLVWEPWEILLGIGAVALALLYYGSVDVGHWLARHWRRWQKQRLVSSLPASRVYR